MLSDILFRLKSLFRRNAVEAELAEELHVHMEREVEKLMQRGATREEATRRARLSFGGADKVKEECREARGVHFMETMLQDLALRRKDSPEKSGIYSGDRVDARAGHRRVHRSFQHCECSSAKAVSLSVRGANCFSMAVGAARNAIGL